VFDQGAFLERLLTMTLQDNLSRARCDTLDEEGRSRFWMTTTFLLAYVAVTLFVVGCGGDSSRASISRVRPTLSLPFTQAQAIAYSKAINLRATDVPMMTSISAEGKTETSRFTTEVTQCRGGFPGWEVGSIHSARFQQKYGPEIVMSAVQVMRSRSIAEQDLVANLNAHVRACIASVLDARPPSGTLVRKHVAISLLPSLVPRTIDSFGMRVTVLVAYQSAVSGKRIRTFPGKRITQDILGFASGPAEVALIDTHGPQAFPSPTERRLLSLLYVRARKRSGLLDK
jgi:hypothetical protein